MENYFLKIGLIFKNKKIVYFATILLLVFLSACGSDKEVKKISEDSILVNESFKFLDSLRIAYLERDLKKLEDLSTKDLYMELITVMKSFDKADLTFTPTWVELTDSMVKVTISWKGTWVTKEKVIDDKGVAIFILEVKPFKLAKILRTNPFSQPE